MQNPKSNCKNDIDNGNNNIEKNIERINLMNDIEFSNHDWINYKLTTEKGKFWIDLKINLMHLGVDVQAIPNVENLKKIQVRKLIYFDGFSHHQIMNDLFVIMSATELCQLVFRNFSDYMREKFRKD